MENVYLSDIAHVSRGDLRDSRLDDLENGYSSFEEVLNSSSDPITLSGSKPYEIIDGQHRIYLARQKGYTKVRAQFR